jgi:hypothetical protein
MIINSVRAYRMSADLLCCIVEIFTAKNLASMDSGNIYGSPNCEMNSQHDDNVKVF